MASLPYPLTKPTYRLFLLDSNKNKDIVNNVKNYLTTLEIYTNKFIEEQSNTSKLSSYIQSMEQSSYLILSTLKKCASSTETNKCKSTDCEFNKELQLIIIDLIEKFTSITSVGIKKNYKFLSLMLTNSFSKIITDNNKNKYRNGTYYLCDVVEIAPPDPNGQLFSEYQELVSDAEILKENNDKQVLINIIITWLQYIALLIVVTTIGIIVYNKFFKKKADIILNKIGGYLSKYN